MAIDHAKRRKTEADAPSEFGSAAFDEAARHDLALPDLDWSVLPDGAERVTFDVPSGRLAGMAQGEKGRPRVLLVPGVTGSKEDFLLMLPVLADAGYRVESFDLAGQYQSADAGPANLSPPRTHYDYDLFVDDLIAVLESGATPVHVLGYSFAGLVTQFAFARRPALFASVTLLSCPPRPGQSFRGMKRVGWLTGLGPDRWGAWLLYWGIRRNVTSVPPGRLRFANARFAFTRRSSVNDVIGLMRHTPDAGAALANARLPKLVAVGEHDLWPMELHAEFAQRIGAALAAYGAGHSPCESAPHQLSRDMIALFSKSPAAG